MATELMMITLADGRALRCTPEHKIATARGFVRADALRYLDYVLSGNEWQSLLLGLYSRVRSTGFRVTITDAMNGASEGHPISIGRFGKAAMALCRKAMRSITETGTLLTMPWRTLSVSTPLSTRDSTRWNVVRLAFSKTPAAIAWNEQRNGTQVQKVWSGTHRTGVMHGKHGNGTTSLARTVVRRLLRLSRRERNGVISIVRWRPSGSGEGSQLVYDLTVKNHACYAANGVLVSNSDSLRYMAIGTRETIAPPEPERFKDSWERAWARANREDVQGWRVA